MSTLPRKRAAGKRRTTSPRCVRQRCSHRQEIYDRCSAHADDEAWSAFSLWVRERDGRCTAAEVLPDTPCSGRLQAAHGVGRRKQTTRFDPRNVHALCEAHHVLVDSQGQEGAKYVWLTSILGKDGYDQLMRDSRVPSKRLLVILEAFDRYVGRV